MPFTVESRATAPVRGPNKFSKTVKESVLGVFNKLQEEPEHKANLLVWAKKNPNLFYPIAARLIPTEITATIRKVIRVQVGNGEEQPKIEDVEHIEIESKDFLE